MRLDQLLNDTSMRLVVEDQDNEDYIRDDGQQAQLAINCWGHYTVAELEIKLRQLKEANRLRASEQLDADLRHALDRFRVC